MQIPFPQFWLTLLIVGILAGSAAVWFAIAVRWHNDGTALPYEPRMRVPWNFLGAVPAVYWVFQAASVAIFGGPEIATFDLWQALAAAVVLFSLLFLAMLLLGGLFHASAQDIGIPASIEVLNRDIRLGFYGYLAAIVPVTAVQIVILYFSQDLTPHPLVKSLVKNPSPSMLVAALVTAVIVAPIVEEFFFRVLLQGWLERVEDRVIGFRSTERPAPVEVAAVLDADEEASQEESDVSMVDSKPQASARGIVPLMGHGFIPIALSSTLFSLAHLGHGIAPVAIFVLALFLGYLYQRTHRIVPCIVLHMVFNAINLINLWLELQLPRPLFLPELE